MDSSLCESVIGLNMMKRIVSYAWYGLIIGVYMICEIMSGKASTMSFIKKCNIEVKIVSYPSASIFYFIKIKMK